MIARRLAASSLLLLLAQTALADRDRPTPPDFAFEACSAAVENDSCEVTTPRGDALGGVCRLHDDALACIPDRPPHGRPPRGEAPAEEAV